MSVDLKTLKILLADDEPDNLLLLETILNFHDIEPLCAASGQKAIALLAEQKFDVALVDIQMPKVTGWDIAKAIHANPAQRDMILIAVTALAMGGDQERVLRAGFHGYISKPVETAQFFQTVQNIVNGTLALRAERKANESLLTADDSAPELATAKNESVPSPVAFPNIAHTIITT